MKLISAVGAGGQAKAFLLLSDVLVNGQVERRRGRKLYAGDVVLISGETYTVVGGK